MNNKYKSRKFLAACWAAILITTLSIISLITKFDPSWMGSLLPLLTSVVVVWVGGESLIDREATKKTH